MLLEPIAFDERSAGALIEKGQKIDQAELRVYLNANLREPGRKWRTRPLPSAI